MVSRSLRCTHALLLLLLDLTSASSAAVPGVLQGQSIRIFAPDGSIARDDNTEDFARTKRDLHLGGELRLQRRVGRSSLPSAALAQYMRQEPEDSGEDEHEHNTTTDGPSTTESQENVTSKTSNEAKHSKAGASSYHVKYGPPHAPAKKFFGLPAWVAVLVGGLWAALIVICTNLLGAYFGSTAPTWASGEQKLRHEVQQAVEKVAILEIALKDKIEEEEKRAEDEARAAAGEEKKEEPGASYDELVGEMLYRTKDTQGKAIDAVNNSIRQAAPMLARASHIQEVFTTQMTGARERVTELGRQQANAMYSRMKEAVGVDMDAADVAEMGAGLAGMEMPDWLTVNDDDVDPPPFALLLGGILAPMQLSATKSNYLYSITTNSIMLGTLTACSVMDASRRCPDPLVWVWQYGMVMFNGLDIMCNSFLIARCTSALGSLKEDEERMTHIRKTGNSVWDAYIGLQSHSGQFFKAYFAYQSVVDSKAFSLQKVLSIVMLGWGCLGIWITCEDIVKDTLHCEAKIVLYFLHAYSFWFLLTLTWTVLGVIFWIIQKASNSVAVTGPILQYAKEWDEEIIFKLPLWQTITRGLILRDSSTMLRIKARQFAIDLEESTKKLEEDKLLFEKRRAALQDLSSKRERAAQAEQEIIDIYKEKLREQGEYVADDARPPDDDDDDRPGGGGASSSGSGGGGGGASSSGGGGGASSSGGGGGAGSSGGGGGAGSSGGGGGAGSSGGGGGASSSGGGGGSGGAGSAGAAGASSSSGLFGLDSASLNQQLTTVAAAGSQLGAADVMAASSGAQQGAADFFASAQAQATERGAGLAAGAQGFFTSAQFAATAAAPGPPVRASLPTNPFAAESMAPEPAVSASTAPAAATAAAPGPPVRASLPTNPFAAEAMAPEPAASAPVALAVTGSSAARVTEPTAVDTLAAAEGSSAAPVTEPAIEAALAATEDGDAATSSGAAPVERASVTAAAPEPASRASLPTAAPFTAEAAAPEPAASPPVAAAEPVVASSSTAPVTQTVAEAAPATAEGGAAAPETAATAPPAAAGSLTAPVTETMAEAMPAAAEGAAASSSSSSAAAPAAQGEAAPADEAIPGVSESW